MAPLTSRRVRQMQYYVRKISALLAVAALLGAMAFVLACGGDEPEEPEPEPTATAMSQPEATATSQPTRAPRPTATAVPPASSHGHAPADTRAPASSHGRAPTHPDTRANTHSRTGPDTHPRTRPKPGGPGPERGNPWPADSGRAIAGRSCLPRRFLGWIALPILPGGGFHGSDNLRRERGSGRILRVPHAGERGPPEECDAGLPGRERAAQEQ